MASRKHARFSASGAHRWLNCPGSVPLSDIAPPSVESEYAREGTLAHECLEKVLNNWDPTALELSYPPEMIEYANAAAQIITELQEDGELLVETKVDLSFVHPESFGTVDAAIVEEFGTLYVIDYKYGAGIPVSPEENEQLIYYALGIANLYDFNFKEVMLVIIQPRAASEDGKIVKEWKISIDDLFAWKDKFKAAIQASFQDPPEYHAGDWCRFCPAASICPELSQKSFKEAQIDFAPEKGIVEVPQPTQLTPEILSRTLTAIDRIEFWISSVRAHAFEALKRGESIPGYKLVPRRAVRKWEDPVKISKLAAKKFGARAFEQKLLTPAQFEKKVDKAFVEVHAVAVSSGVTLAPDSDRRTGINPIENEFSEISDF